MKKRIIALGLLWCLSAVMLQAARVDIVCLRLYLRAVHVLHVKTNESLIRKNEHKLREYVVDLVLQTVAETVDCYEVRLFIPCQPNEMYVAQEQLLYAAT